jgi:Domain of unknown function (DUF4873)
VAGRIPLPTRVIRDRSDKARFDATTETWTVTTGAGRSESARVVIDARPSDDATIAVHGLPNYFRIPGPDVERQTRFVQGCLDLFEKSGATRIEARSRIMLSRTPLSRTPLSRKLLSRWHRRPRPRRFHLSGTVPVDDDLYDGPAVLELAGRTLEVRARLSGHVEAIDGHYHWQGTISGDLPADVFKGTRAVTLSTPTREAQARIVEQTPWGGYTVTGTGTPPFPLS